MSRIGLSANTQTLLMLALIANQPQIRNDVMQKESLRHPLQRNDPETVMRSYVNSVLYPLVQDPTYGPIYARLLTYSIERIEFELVVWALRADRALFFREEQVESTSQQTDGDRVHSQDETSVMWDALAQNDHLLHQLKRLSREWEHNVRRGARMLRAYFTLHCPIVMRTYECPFLIQALLGLSLERINWIELAALVLGVPVPEQLPLKREEVEEHDPHVQLAILQEVLELSQNDFGEYMLSPWCSDEVQGLCASLADQCGQAQRELTHLKEQGRVFEE